jgi:hypothetical protein
MEKSLLITSVQELYPESTAHVQAILQELRELVRATLPDAHEVFYHGALGYGPSGSYIDRILYIASQKDYANLGFFFGSHLSDPHQLMSGTGARMRHVKIRRAPLALDMRSDLVALVQEAWVDGVDSVARMHQRPSRRG